MGQQKNEARNQALLDYQKVHPEATYQQIGDSFGVTRQRVWFIIRREKRVKR